MCWRFGNSTLGGPECKIEQTMSLQPCANLVQQHQCWETCTEAPPRCPHAQLSPVPSKSITSGAVSQHSPWLCACQNQTCPPSAQALLQTELQPPLTIPGVWLDLLCLLASAPHLPGTEPAGVTSTQGCVFIGKPTA